MYSLNKDETLALSTAMGIVGCWNTYFTPQIIIELYYDNVKTVDNDLVFKPFDMFAHLSKEDIYNLVWSYQERIYQAMCLSEVSK